MSDALRSAVPVCEASRKQHAMLQRVLAMSQSYAHPNIVVVEGFSTAVEGGVALFSRCRPGCVLRDVLCRYPRIEPLTILRWGFGVLSALAFLHERGVAYGALSMDNILVDVDGRCQLKAFYPDYVAMCTVFRRKWSCYVSPAMAAGAPPTPACDMFCYGMLSLEAISGQRGWRWGVAAEGQPPRTEKELVELLQAGGQDFCDAVTSGLVVVNELALDSAVVVANYAEDARDAVRMLLSYRPSDRPTAAGVRELNKSILAARGLVLTEDLLRSSTSEEA
ncbi:Protein tyrosine kinase/Protein kinase domain containing protein [Novymonas esmeraldas]|uniref:Protein tyrosine kinase/Protein kinase domain containing protein n=1 Tax=Novymonas esmeraldas TaxID=1808958 RepID=A0AAW0F2N9_9TRYP